MARAREGVVVGRKDSMQIEGGHRNRFNK